MSGDRDEDGMDGRAWDWESFYREAEYDRCIYLAGEEMVDYLDRFFQVVGVPDSVADVGCGPAVALFELAARYPATEFVGYDVSETVVRDNAALAREEGLDNLAFAVDALPDLDADRQFDLVYCVATLFFVADPRPALRSLFERVRPGGHLVVNYPTETVRAVADAEFEGGKRDAFELVIAGENLLTRGTVEDALGTELRDYWDAVEAEDVSRDQWPTVYAQKAE